MAAVSPVLPAWIDFATLAAHRYPDAESRIALAIDLSRQNVEHVTGGPFGAAVFADAALIAVGVNRVDALASSLAHAEIVALVLAQQHLGRARLNAGGASHFTLAASAQPCCQCYGAIAWAGIDELLIGARIEDTQSLAGFDEGPLPVDWSGELERRGIHVQPDLQRAQACTVLADYRARGGASY